MQNMMTPSGKTTRGYHIGGGGVLIVVLKSCSDFMLLKYIKCMQNNEYDSLFEIQSLNREMSNEIVD